MSRARAYRAAWLWDHEGGLRPGGWLALEDGAVRGVTERRPGDAECVDLGRGILLPGLVNAHTHTELAFLAGLVEPAGDFVGWIEALVAARPGHDRVNAGDAAAAAAASMRAAGIALVGDVTNTGRARRALHAAGLHHVAFFEALGPGAAEPPQAETAWDGGLLAAAAVAAHSPYSVPAARIKALKARAGELPFCIHAAESRAEAELIAGAGPEGERLASFIADRGVDVGRLGIAPGTPLAYLMSLGVVDAGTLLVHGVQIARSEIGPLAASGASLCLCPRSNLGLTGGLAPAPELLAAGVNLALGTDSLASTPDLDLWAEMAVLLEHFPELSPQAVLTMASAGGARALGQGKRFGRLGPGARAPLCFAPLADDIGPGEALAAAAHGELAGPMQLVE